MLAINFSRKHSKFHRRLRGSSIHQCFGHQSKKIREKKFHFTVVDVSFFLTLPMTSRIRVAEQNQDGLIKLYAGCRRGYVARE